MTGELRTRIAAALRAIPSDGVRASLEAIGDALRGSLALPDAATRWLSGVSIAEISAALPDLAGVADARERDRVESLRTGVLRWALAHRIAPVNVPGAPQFHAAVQQLDVRLAAGLSRPAAEAQLGPRVALLGGRPWTAALPEGDAIAEPADPLPAPTTLAIPSVEVVAAYVAEGEHAAYVEGAAARHAEFRGDLADAIRETLAEREPVAFLARRWIRTHGGDVAEPMHVAVLPRRVLAASTGDEPAPERSGMFLGALAPDIQGRLVAAPDDHLALVVYAPPGALREVRFGATATTAPEHAAGADKWTAAIPAREGPARVALIAADGAVVLDDTLVIAHA